MVNLGLAIGIAIIVPTIAFAQRSHGIPDIPDNHWAYEAAADLQKTGLLIGFRPLNIFSSGPPKNDLQFTTATQEAIRNLHKVALDLQARREKIAHSPERPPTEGKTDNRLLDMIATIQKDLLDLTKEFSPELRQRGEDLAKIAIQIREDCVKIASFPDVPKNHWASQATMDLSALGILRGYPSGKFGG